MWDAQFIYPPDPAPFGCRWGWPPVRCVTGGCWRASSTSGAFTGRVWKRRQAGWRRHKYGLQATASLHTHGRQGQEQIWFGSASILHTVYRHRQRFTSTSMLAHSRQAQAQVWFTRDGRLTGADAGGIWGWEQGGWLHPEIIEDPHSPSPQILQIGLFP